MSDREEQDNPENGEEQGRSRDEFVTAKILAEHIRKYQDRNASLVGPSPDRPRKIRYKVRYKKQEDELTDDAIRLRKKNLTVQLRRIVAFSAIIFVAIQLALSNLFFGSYIYANLHDLDASVMIAWLSATVIEVIGILGIVTLSLFPNKNRNQRASKRFDHAISGPEA